MRRWLEAPGLVALALLYWITWHAVSGPTRLPGKIPIHFDLQGNPTGWGSPAGLLLLPVLATLLYGGISLIARFPSAFNYPVRVTPMNRFRLEGITLDMIAFLKIEVVCLFAWIQWTAIGVMRDGRNTASPPFFQAAIAVIFATIAIHIVRLVRASRR